MTPILYEFFLIVTPFEFDWTGAALPTFFVIGVENVFFKIILFDAQTVLSKKKEIKAWVLLGWSRTQLLRLMNDFFV